jgi:hypothetical protein
VSMLLIAISIAAGLLVAQGLALAVATWGAKLCCCRHEEDSERKRRGGGTVQVGIDLVYF